VRDDALNLHFSIGGFTVVIRLCLHAIAAKGPNKEIGLKTAKIEYLIDFRAL